MAVTGKTKVIGIFGFPIEHSLSPVMHNRAFDFLGLDYSYVPFLIAGEKLEQAVEGIRAMNLVGVNVTIPHKSAVIPFLDEVSPEAKALGAVNVIVNHDGFLKGYNTDGPGFYKSMVDEAGTKAKGKKVVILGAGGAARGVAFELASQGAASITVLNRNLQKAADLVEDLRNTYPDCLTESLDSGEDVLGRVIPSADILINSTPVGMYPHHNEPSPVNSELIRPGLVVCDFIYNPLETVLLKEARERGAITLSGLGMLLYQGVLAFKLWTGQDAPVEVMREALLQQMDKGRK